MLQSRRTSCFVVDSSKTQAHHENPPCHVGAFVAWNLPIGLQRSRSQLEFEVNLRPKFRGNPGFREIPVWRCTPFRPRLPSAPGSLPPHTPFRPILPSAPDSHRPHTPFRPILPSAPGSLPPDTPIRPILPSAPYSHPPHTPLRPILPFARYITGGKSQRAGFVEAG